jgi:hypothetical protein
MKYYIKGVNIKKISLYLVLLLIEILTSLKISLSKRLIILKKR